jgi:hypothetical protein
MGRAASIGMKTGQGAATLGAVPGLVTWMYFVSGRRLLDPVGEEPFRSGRIQDLQVRWSNRHTESPR